MRYSYNDIRVDIHTSALKHGITRDDILAVASAYLVAYSLGDEHPARELRLGFTQSGLLLEVVVLVFDQASELVIHAMKARRSYFDLLP